MGKRGTAQQQRICWSVGISGVGGREGRRRRSLKVTAADGSSRQKEKFISPGHLVTAAAFGVTLAVTVRVLHFLSSSLTP